MNISLIEKETCPRCGEKFDCGKSVKCWCYEVDIPASVMDKISQDFNNCLCPECIQELSQKTGQ